MRRLWTGGVLGVLWAGLALGAEPAAAEFFEREVRPILVERCQKCHGGPKPKGGLRLTGRATILGGGGRGPAAVVGKPDDSLLVKAIRYADGDLRMPPKDKLPERDIATLTRWVQAGLPWPDAPAVTSAAPAKGATFTEEQRSFWAFQPVRDPAVPIIRNPKSQIPTNPIDAFIRAKLEEKGLRPAPPADRRTLLRRATFDLTGLPPTPEDVEAFVHDPAPDAYAKLIDRLLASPAYGERWGRHWLDLVRYTDSFDARGLGGLGDCAEAWRYRDWVIAAFNRDLPYDCFVRQQVAGDLLPEAPGGPRTPDGIVATGMLAIGNWGGGDADKEKLLTDIADDQVDVVSRTVLGLTVACARCHDHKFDPISQADYYGLAGIFFSTHILPDVGPKTNGPNMLLIPLLAPEDRARRERLTARIAESERRFEQVRGEAVKAFAEQLRPLTAEYVLAAWDYAHRPADESAVTAADFAARRGLHGFALRQWLDALGLGGDDRPLDRVLRDVGGRPGVHGRRGPEGEPNLLVNTTGEEVSIVTFKLPPRSVAVHPGPRGGVVLSWRSPVSGTVSVRGRLTDADPNCGDGVAWTLDRRTSGGRVGLAAGGFENGGAQSLTEGERAKALAAVPVREGESLELVVLPKASHACDTTVVELVIAEAGGPRVWDVARDLSANPDSINSGVWHVADATARGRGLSDAVRAWQRDSAAAADRAALEEAARTFAAAFHPKDADDPFRVRDATDESALPAETRTELARLRTERDELQRTLGPPPAVAIGAQEGGVPGSPHAGTHDVRIHIRGRYDRLGEPVPRRFPAILAGDRQPTITQGSGRRELAEWLADPHNPLTARVMVNRLWQHHFGAGIVRTPSNFGALGERPTHPELLDWLAARFVAGGWSVKQMHRLIMLSATYQQSSSTQHSDDADNRLWGRQNRRRLEAEALRDSLLAAAGRLDRTIGGPADRDFARPRRTVYQMTIRSDRSGYGPLFDAADPTAPVDRRTESTVAPQALFLMNHPFVREQARAVARLLAGVPGVTDQRIESAYRLLYGRPPSAEELSTGRELLGDQAAKEPAWVTYCQVLLCANEFLYVD
jgi:hypothetical protein